MTATDATPRRVRLRAVALLAITLVAGILLGAVLQRVRTTPFGALSEDRQRARLTRLYNRLDLTVEQRERVDGIIARRTSQATAIWEPVRIELVAVVDSATGEIRAVLTPEQRARYDRIVERQRNRNPWLRE